MNAKSILRATLLLVATILFSKVAISGCISVAPNTCDSPPISDPVTGGTAPVVVPGPITISPIKELEIQALLTFTAPLAVVAASNWNAAIDQYSTDVNNNTATSPEWVACRFTLQCGLGTSTAIESPWNSLLDTLNLLAPDKIALAQNTTVTTQSVSITLKIDPQESDPAPNLSFDVARRLLLQQRWTIPVDEGNPSDATRIPISADVHTIFPSVVFLSGPAQQTVIAGRFSIRVNAQLLNNGMTIGGQDTETEIALQNQGEFTGVEIWPLSQTTPYPAGTVAVVTLSIAAEAVIDRNAPLVDIGSGTNTPVASPGEIVLAAPVSPPDANESITPAPADDTSTATHAQSGGGGPFGAIELMVAGLLLPLFARRGIVTLPSLTAS